MGTTLLNQILLCLHESEFVDAWDCELTELVDSNCYTFYPKNYSFLETSYKRMRSIVGIGQEEIGLFVLSDYKGHPNIGVRFFASKDAEFTFQLY